MAQSMGATSDQLAELSANASDGSQALSVTNEQLENLAVADWSSQVLDAVGGEDAFNAIMDNLFSNVFDSIDAYAANLDYYNEKAAASIATLGDSTVTVENFWNKFNEAIKSGLAPDEFEAWGKASSWVANIDSVTEAMENFDTAMTQFSQSLDARMQKANGYTYEAEKTQQLSDAEAELVAAREAGYSAAMLARLQEVQAAELAATIAKHVRDYEDALRDANSRIATALDDQSALIAIQMQENALELSDLAKIYNWSVGSAEEPLFQALQQAQALEIANTILETAKALADAEIAMENDIAARRAVIEGYEEESEALQMVAGYQDELSQAYADGLDSSLIADLMKVQLDELAKYWEDTLDEMQDNLRDLYQQQADLLGSLAGNTQDAVSEIYDLFTRYKAGETDLADDIIDALESISAAVDSMVDDIYDTISEIRFGENYSTDTADVNAATARSYFEEVYAKAASGDTEAMGSVTNYATSYLDAVKSSTADASVYQSAQDYVISMLSRLSNGASSSTGGLTDIAEQVTNDQIAEAELAIKKAEVAQLKTTYDTLLAQTIEAFKGSDGAKYISALATTGAGWQGLGDLFVDYEGDGFTRLQELQNGTINFGSYIGWFQQNYGTGTGYVDWEGAMKLWKTYGSLPSNVSSLYAQSQTAYANWQTLKSQYGFASGGVVGGGSTTGDNLLAFVNSKERIIPDSHNAAYERGLDIVSRVAMLEQPSGGELLSVMREIRSELKAIRGDMQKGHTEIIKRVVKTNDKLERWDIIGQPPVRTSTSAVIA